MIKTMMTLVMVLTVSTTALAKQKYIKQTIKIVQLSDTKEAATLIDDKGNERFEFIPNGFGAIRWITLTSSSGMNLGYLSGISSGDGYSTSMQISNIIRYARAASEQCPLLITVKVPVNVGESFPEFVGSKASACMFE